MFTSAPGTGISTVTLPEPFTNWTVMFVPFGSVTITVPFIGSPVTGSSTVILSVVFPFVVFVTFAVTFMLRGSTISVIVVSVELYLSLPG